MEKVWIAIEGYCDIDDMFGIEKIRAFSSEELCKDFLSVQPSWHRFYSVAVDVETNADSFLPTWEVEDRTKLGRGFTATRVQHLDHEIDEVWEIDDYKTRQKWPAVVVRARDGWSAIGKAAEKFAQFKAEKAGIA